MCGSSLSLVWHITFHLFVLPLLSFFTVRWGRNVLNLLKVFQRKVVRHTFFFSAVRFLSVSLFLSCHQEAAIEITKSRKLKKRYWNKENDWNGIRHGERREKQREWQWQSSMSGQLASSAGFNMDNMWGSHLSARCGSCLSHQQGNCPSIHSPRPSAWYTPLIYTAYPKACSY